MAHPGFFCDPILIKLKIPRSLSLCFNTSVQQVLKGSSGTKARRVQWVRLETLGSGVRRVTKETGDRKDGEDIREPRDQ